MLVIKILYIPAPIKFISHYDLLHWDSDCDLASHVDCPDGREFWSCQN